MSKKSISQKDMKILWGRSGNKCAICKTGVIQVKKEGNEYPIGDMAHIVSENPGSARYSTKMADDEKCKYNNLVLLCPNCHVRIDNNEQEYTVEKLRQIKKDHENWVDESLKRYMPEMTFAELEVILKHLTNILISEDVCYVTIPTKEKIEKNKLSSRVEKLIKHGMLQVKQVKSYLNKNPDIQFAERLRAGFVSKYRDIKKEGLEGDALFYELLDFASGSSSDFLTEAAGLSVLTYFFDICEVFEG
jgi:hypothetical protein